MAKGYKWVRVQIPVELHERVVRQKGRTSWDDTIVRALVAMLNATAGNDPPVPKGEVARG
jgi:hypothetical protein